MLVKRRSLPVAFCIPMKKRCDALGDCVDGSDEQDCGRLVMPQEYMKDLTPIQNSHEEVLVNFSLNIIQIEVDENTNTFVAKISMTRQWFDRRLTYKHLKNDSRRMNSFPPEEIDAIWFPVVIFFNIRSKEVVRETDCVTRAPVLNFIRS